MISPAEAVSWARVLRGLGGRRLAYQALHRARLKAGWYERSLPTDEWQALPDQVLHSARSVFHSPQRDELRAQVAAPDRALSDGQRILGGELCYFSSRWLPRPSDWRSNPLTGWSTPEVHWSTLPPFAGEAQGDVKWIWEASRFDWVYRLARAWAAAPDATTASPFAEAFWDLLQDWRDNNRPNQGINWRCGQECAFRLFALTWAAAIFSTDPSWTPARAESLWSTVEALAQRIDRAMAHALSQHNNHGLSESAALVLAGTCLPAHSLAGQWVRKGRKHFERQVLEQFTTDGAYSQHSMNYTRVALRDAFVYLRALRFEEDDAPGEVLDRLGAATEFLYQVQEPATGELPNYGANDGANILHLSSCPYEDFRSSLTLLTWELDGTRRYEPGPWDEELAWHVGSEALEAPSAPRRRRSFGREASGYFALRGERSFGLIRCHSFTDRPGHADMLHLDLWLDGRNILLDPGSYSYNDPRGWGTFLKGTSAHNTVTVDGKDQMRPGSRFLWLDWTRSSCRRFGQDRIPGWTGWLFDGEHYGYRSGEGAGLCHRRQVFLSEDEWLVVDDLDSDRAEHQLRLRWLLGGTMDWTLDGNTVHSEALGYQVSITGPGTCLLEAGEDALPHNGFSRTYGELTPASLLTLQCQTGDPVRWITRIGRLAGPDTSDRTWQGLTVSPTPGGPIE